MDNSLDSQTDETLRNDHPRSPTPDNATPDSQINHEESIKYWTSIDADVNGMLGGFAQISHIDLKGSAQFLSKVVRLYGDDSANSRLGPWGLGVDCGAGIGRITKGFLTRVCETVDVVEPVEKFASAIRESRAEYPTIGEIYVIGLEAWEPFKQYDLIWLQWCVGYLTDEQLAQCLKRCKNALSEHGLIVVKENVSTESEGQDMYDSEDSSVTRTDQKFKAIFEQAGLNLIRSELQRGFPKKLLPVRFYALRPT